MKLAILMAYDTVTEQCPTYWFSARGGLVTQDAFDLIRQLFYFLQLDGCY